MHDPSPEGITAYMKRTDAHIASLEKRLAALDTISLKVAGGLRDLYTQHEAHLVFLEELLLRAMEDGEESDDEDG